MRGRLDELKLVFLAIFVFPVVYLWTMLDVIIRRK